MNITVDYHQTNQKTNTGKTLKPWPILVDHYTNEEVILTVAISEERFNKLHKDDQASIIENVTADYYENKAAEEIERQFK
ncbi:hypothetical protein AB6G20_15745 [Providencia hangzhouensis]|uniref:hypothetical protein n=1 Tax=Providencia hangzhouensis TaxID=3031799 RepID=UPI0034DD917F